MDINVCFTSLVGSLSSKCMYGTDLFPHMCNVNNCHWTWIYY